MVPRGEDFHNGTMPIDIVKKQQRAYVQEVCDRLNVTYTELARRAGVDPATLTRFMNNPRYKHALGAKTLHKLELVGGSTSGPMPDLRNPINISYVRVLGVASAGAWKELGLLASEDFSHEEIPVVANVRYAGKRQYALRIEGTSMNRRMPDGTYAICVAWDDLGIEPKDGQLVHVERERAGTREVTVKQVRTNHRGIELWPDSDDPLWQEAVSLSHPDEGTEVVIRGLVIGTFSHLV